MTKKAIVIGSGIAGIASAIRLRSKGYEVEVFEANSYPGGKLTEIKLGAYRFDAGPSLFTMPQYIEELFRVSGKEISDYFKYEKCDVSCKYFFEDGVVLNFFQDKSKLLDEVSSKLDIDTEPLKKHYESSEFIYNKTSGAFLEQSLHKFQNYFSKAILKCVLAIPRLKLFTTLHKDNVRNLNHPKLVQIFDRYATYNGSNPYKAPGILNVIPHLEQGFGTFFPEKGMHSITKSLVKLAEDIGVNFIFNSKVEEIKTIHNRVEGVVVNAKLISADVVICNSDIKPAYQYLIPNLKKPKKTLNQEPSSSAMIFYWGIKKNFQELDLHNIFFSEDYQNEFHQIFEEGLVSDDPTIYLNITSTHLPSDAPIDAQNWFVMVNVPSNNGQNWNEFREKIRSNVIQKLSRILKEDVEKLIEVEDYLDPIRIESRTSSFAGALYGASSNERTAAFFRHPNFSKVKGLYFVGGSVHPGGGIPLCLLSAKIVDDIL